MKKQNLTLLVSTLLSLSPGAFADLGLSAVTRYDSAEGSAIWKSVKVDQVPSVLVSQETMTDPASAYGAIFPKSFLQQSNFVVCYQDCAIEKKIEKPMAFQVMLGITSVTEPVADSFSVNQGSTTTLSPVTMKEVDLLEQTNVYFWLTKYFKHLEEKYAFQQKHFLMSRTNVDLEIQGKQAKNNAFFTDQDFSLNFLPANKGLLFRLFDGKINRSGLDPSVISHEVSHFFFWHLYPFYVNNEIGGLNEGFADYIAHTFLNNPKMGLVMMRGKALRDASVKTLEVEDENGKKQLKDKVYEPNLEVHDLGERTSYMLWSMRNVVEDKNAFDQIVVESVKELSQSIYSNIHDFKSILKKNIAFSMDQKNALLAESFLEAVIPGEQRFIENLEFPEIDTNVTAPKQSFYKKLELTTEQALKLGLPMNIIITRVAEVAEVNVSEHLSARLMEVSINGKTFIPPLWYVFDDERGNLHGVFDSKKNAVTAEGEYKKLASIASQAQSVTSFKADYIKTAKAMADLYIGQGSLSKVYKKDKELTTEGPNWPINGDIVKTKNTKITVKKKLIGKILPGIMDVASITLLTTSEKVSVPDLPTFKGETIIGYTMESGDGMKNSTFIEYSE